MAGSPITFDQLEKELREKLGWKDEHLAHLAETIAFVVPMAEERLRKMKHEELKKENLEFRRWWWVNHGKILKTECSFSSLYGDDGEMQCGKCGKDFLRDSPESLFIVETL